MTFMHDLTLKAGASGPVSYTCKCRAIDEGGTVLLFYRYWSNTPSLPDKHRQNADRPELLAEWHRDLTVQLNLRGKLRIAKEGFNITVGGTSSEIDEYMKFCHVYWSIGFVGGMLLDWQAIPLWIGAWEVRRRRCLIRRRGLPTTDKWHWLTIANLESANEAAQGNIYTLTHVYVGPCLTGFNRPHPRHR